MAKKYKISKKKLAVLLTVLCYNSSLYAAELPNFYDYRLKNPADRASGKALNAESILSPVGNQGNYGTCWAFAAIGAVESNWRKQLLAADRLSDETVPQLSTRYLAWNTYTKQDEIKDYPVFVRTWDARTERFLDPYQSGGMARKATAIMIRGTGLAWEGEVPYGPLNGGMQGVNALKPAAGLVTDSYEAWLNESGEKMDSLAKRQRIKSVLMNTSAVIFGANASGNMWSGKDIFTPEDRWPNHDILLVGWDDDYDFANSALQVKPQGKGAWIIRNSWGTGYGESGYQYVSYEDRTLDISCSYRVETDAKKFTLIDRHKGLDVITWDSLSAEATKGFASSYKSTEDQFVKAVGFYVNNDNSSYEIEIRSNAKNPEAGKTVYRQTGTFGQDGTAQWKGYRTVNLEEVVLVPKGEDYTVIIKCVSPDGKVYFPVSKAYDGYVDGVSAQAGESYIYKENQWRDSIEVFANNTASINMSALAKETAVANGGDFTVAWLYDERNSGKIYLGKTNEFYTTDPLNPERKTLSNMTVNIPAERGEAIYGGEIYGDGRVIKDGTGLLTLSSANTYTGGTTVRNGIMQINGSIASGADVEHAGILAGTGTITGNVNNAGTIKPGSNNQVGNLNVTGNFISSGKLAIAANQAGNSKLDITGNADIANTSFAAVEGSIYEPNKKYEVLNAGVITNNFISTPFTGMLSAEGIIDSNKAYMRLIGANNLPPSASSRQNALFNVMDAMNKNLLGDPRHSEMNKLYSLDAVQAANALTEIGFSSAYGQANAVQQSRIVRSALNSRLSQAKTVVNQPISLTAPGAAKEGPTLDTVIPLELDAQNSWWMKINRGWSNIGARDGFEHTNNQETGFIVGWDKQAGPNWRKGIFMAYGKNTGSTIISNADTRDYQLGIYGGYTKGAQELNTYLSYGKQINRASRSMPLLGISSYSKYNSNTINLGIRSKYDLRHGTANSWKLNPYAAVNVSRYSQDAYRENGAGAFDQYADKMSNTYSTGEIGMELSRKAPTGSFSLNMGYKRVLGGSNPEMLIAFAGNPSEKIRLGGMTQDKNYFVWGMGVEGRINASWTLDGQIESELGKHSRYVTASLMARKRF